MRNKQLQKSKFLLYSSKDGKVFVDVYFKEENIWLTQKLMSQLFEVDRTVITKHLKNIFKSRELDEKSNVQFLHFSHSDKPIKFYNLETGEVDKYLSRIEKVRNKY